MQKVTVDIKKFYQELDNKRRIDNFSWRQVAQFLGLHSSIFTRLSQGKKVDIDIFVTLLSWLGMPLDLFLEPVVSICEEEDPCRLFSYQLRRIKGLTAEQVHAIEDVLDCFLNR